MILNKIDKKFKQRISKAVKNAGKNPMVQSTYFNSFFFSILFFICINNNKVFKGQSHLINL